MEDIRHTLISGLEALALSTEDDKIEKLIHFIKLIAKWNKAYNLTAIKSLDEMVSLHLLDSLAVLPALEGKRIIDVGTGAGLPGIPLAIYRPDIEFVLLDSNAKKTRFVQQAVLELKLKNVSVIHSRVEQYQPAPLFDTVIMRAFASLEDILAQTAHLLSEKGVLLAMKGHPPDEEELNKPTVNASVILLEVPGINAQRCLVRMQHVNLPR